MNLTPFLDQSEPEISVSGAHGGLAAGERIISADGVWYWLRRPEPGTQTAIVYTGVVAPEAIGAAGLLAEDRRGVGVLAVTSADGLSAGWHAAQRARKHGERDACAQVEDLLSELPRDAAIVTLTDAYPEALSWLSGVRTIACGRWGWSTSASRARSASFTATTAST